MNQNSMRTRMPQPSVSTAVACALFGALLLPSSVHAQGTTKTYTRPAAELSEPYTALRGVRELMDGRLIAVDPRDKVVHLVDMRADQVTLLGREGSGPNEYQLPMAVLGLPGDSTMVSDVLNSRFLMLGPGGTLAGTWSPANDASAPDEERERTVTRVAPGSAERQAGSVARRAGAMLSIGGPGGGAMSMIGMRAVDREGRVYLEGSSISMGPDGPQGADSVPVLRMSRETRQSEPVAWLQRPKPEVSGSGGNVSVRIGAGPFPNQDGWAVLPDGRVAVVRAANYQVEIYPASGQGAPVRGTPVKTTPIPVTEEVKQAWRDSRQSGGAIAISVTQSSGPGGGGRSMSTSAPPVRDPDSWPEVLPTFQSSQVYALPNGQIWVGRYREPGDDTPRYDIFNSRGELQGQAVFPATTRIVGFGRGSVYTTRRDDDDLQYLQRYTLQ